MKAVVRKLFYCGIQELLLMPGEIVYDVNYDLDGDCNNVYFNIDEEVYFADIKDIDLSTHVASIGFDTTIIKNSSNKRWAVVLENISNSEMLAVFHHTTRKKAREDKKRLQEIYNVKPNEVKILDLGL